MPRLMSVALTEQAVVQRRKTVTRRAGWRSLTPGTRLTLCRKVMGRKADEPLVRIAEVEVVAVTRERLDQIADADVVREGFSPLDLISYMPADHQQIDPESGVYPFLRHGVMSAAFIRFFCDHMGGAPDQLVTRVEWRYLD